MISLQSIKLNLQLITTTTTLPTTTRIKITQLQMQTIKKAHLLIKNKNLFMKKHHFYQPLFSAAAVLNVAVLNLCKY